MNKITGPRISLSFKDWPFRKRIVFLWRMFQSAILKKEVGMKIPEIQLNLIPSQNSELMAQFMNFAIKHPEMRFWQALSAWSDCRILASHVLSKDGKIKDTYYWEGKHDDVVTH